MGITANMFFFEHYQFSNPTPAVLRLDSRQVVKFAHLVCK